MLPSVTVVKEGRMVVRVVRVMRMVVRVMRMVDGGGLQRV